METKELASSPGGATQPLDLTKPMFTQAPASDGAWVGTASLGDQPSVLGVRELTQEEVTALPPPGNNPGQQAVAASRGQAPARSVERLKTRHHEIARLIAAGCADAEICEGFGVSRPHLYLLRRSPAFQQLMHAYMAARDQDAVSLSQRVKDAAVIGLEKLTEKLAETDSTEIGLDVLQKTTMALLDRAGLSPVHKLATLTGALSPDDIRDIKALHGPLRSTGEHPPAEGPSPPTLEAQASNDQPSDSIRAGHHETGVGDDGSTQGTEGPRLHVRTLRSEGAPEAPAVRPSLDDLDLDRV